MLLWDFSDTLMGCETLVLRKCERRFSYAYQGGIMVIEVLILKEKCFHFEKSNKYQNIKQKQNFQ